jgi:hypothetical protein
MKYGVSYYHNRNFGCRLNEIFFKGYRTLVLENEKIKVSILLDKGADIIEFLYKPLDVNFLWHSPLELNGNNKNPVARPLDGGSFFDIYEGGWQELFPSIPDSDLNGMPGYLSL